MPLRGVLFDLGGVVLGSPLHAIRDFERDHGIAPGFVNRVVLETGPAGAWSRLERGELGLEAFYGAFEVECAAAGRELSARRLMERVHASARPRPAMLAAIRRIRARGLRAGALTNNWISDDDGTHGVREHFDAVVESAVEGLRKPDPRIYELACRRLEVEPGEAVFLDDIGRNLKAARALGMLTIKVDEPDPALDELAQLLGFPLRGD
jgi:putative hydrolase of the HAD superfamily